MSQLSETPNASTSSRSGLGAGVCPVAHGGAKMSGVCPVTHASFAEAESDEERICPMKTTGGLDLSVEIIGGQKNPIPMSNIPDCLTFGDVKQLLQIAKVELPTEKKWEDVEMFLDNNYFYPIPEHVKLYAAEVKHRQTIYLNFKQNDRGISMVNIVLLDRDTPLKIKNLPPYANIAGVQRLLVNILDEEEYEVDISRICLRRVGEKTALPLDFMINNLGKNETLVLTSNDGKSILKQPVAWYMKPRFWTTIILVLIVVCVMTLFVGGVMRWVSNAEQQLQIASAKLSEKLQQQQVRDYRMPLDAKTQQAKESGQVNIKRAYGPDPNYQQLQQLRHGHEL